MLVGAVVALLTILPVGCSLTRPCDPPWKASCVKGYETDESVDPVRSPWTAQR